VFGAKKGLNQTLKSVFYGGSPNYLLGWIPLINIIAGLWSLVLAGIGLTRLQGIKGGKAAGAIIIAILIPLIITMVLLFAFFGAFLAMFGMAGLANFA
jgi:pilus assembly protein TadC